MNYFFITSKEFRDGEMKNTLRALPNQTFPDGRPIDTTLNVMSPKNAKDYKGGTRLEYPLGTVFCSEHLEEVTSSGGKVFYSVYQGGDMSKEPHFHPVSDDPSFNFLKPEHRNDVMNAAYALYKIGFIPEENNEKDKQMTPNYSPKDENGFAIPEIENWKERYEFQLEIEAELFKQWLKNLMDTQNVVLAHRILMSQVEQTFNKLYRCGESLETIINQRRFEKVMEKEKITYSDLSSMSKGPHSMYLSALLEEHKNKDKCSALERDPQKAQDVADFSFVVCKAHNDEFSRSETHNAGETLKNIATAIEAGWTINDLVEPERLKTNPSYVGYMSDVANNKLPLPERMQGNKASYIDTILSDKKYKKPTSKTGFHVENVTWKIIVENLTRRRNTLLLGPTGTGKTELIQRLCEQTGTELTIISMGGINDPDIQLGGRWDIDTVTGGTRFELSDFAKAIQKPGIILLDEINRIPKHGYNKLFNVLDSIRTLKIEEAKTDEQRKIKVHEGCAFFATANIGAEYGGTAPLDAALANRFMPVLVDYLPLKTEESILKERTGIKEGDAFNIAFIAGQIRELAKKETISFPISTRETIRCAELVKDGFSCLEAMELCFLPLYQEGSYAGDPSSERAAVKKIIMARMNQKKE